jgi:hypothetical protein
VCGLRASLCWSAPSLAHCGSTQQAMEDDASCAGSRQQVMSERRRPAKRAPSRRE